MKHTTLPDWTVPLALLAASILAFGITIPWLGLYADDWPFVYVNYLAGPRGVVDFISWVRPVAAWVFAAASALVGTNIWLVHLLLLLLRWLDSVLLWRLLRSVWPQHPQPALWAALLFSVYPAFKQQPLALEYVPHFVALALLFSSLQISARLAAAEGDPQSFPASAARGLPHAIPGAAWSILAWLGSLQVFILEYFVGLEALRPLIVWLILSRRLDRWSAAKRAVRLWLPYLPVLGRVPALAGIRGRLSILPACPSRPGIRLAAYRPAEDRADHPPRPLDRGPRSLGPAPGQLAGQPAQSSGLGRPGRRCPARNGRLPVGLSGRITPLVHQVSAPASFPRAKRLAGLREPTRSCRAAIFQQSGPNLPEPCPLLAYGRWNT